MAGWTWTGLRVASLAAEYALTPEEVAGGGAVIFRSGDRRRAVALLDMAEFAPGEVGGKLVAFRGEEAFAAAWVEGHTMTLEQAIACALEQSLEA